MSQEEQQEECKKQLQDHINIFQESYTTLGDVALKFRKETSIPYKTCQSVIKVLRKLQEQANECLRFLQGNAASFSPFAIAPASVELCALDGEGTAKLILEMDLFATYVLEGYNESLTHAKDRIKMHIQLQSDLSKEVRLLRDVITALKTVLTTPPSPPLPPLPYKKKEGATTA